MCGNISLIQHGKMYTNLPLSAFIKDRGISGDTEEMAYTL